MGLMFATPKIQMKLKIGTKLKVTLLESANKSLEYPCEGELEVFELTYEGKVNVAAFQLASGGGPVACNSPIWKLIKNRRPYREVRVTDNTVPHGVNPRLRVRVYPNGIIEILENGRRSGYETKAGAVFVRCMISSIQAKKKVKQKGVR